MPSPRHRLMIAGGVAALAVIALVVVLAVTRGGGDDTAREPTTVTFSGAVPTPENDPIELDASTDLLAALPPTVLGWALAEQGESTGMRDRFALEGWRLDYTGGTGDVVLQVGQWPTDAEATDAWRDIVRSGDGERLQREDVEVDGDVVGEVIVMENGDGDRAVWRNGTAVLVADAPDAADALAFYEAFPL
jgi:hypothetical protein